MKPETSASQIVAPALALALLAALVVERSLAVRVDDDAAAHHTAVRAAVEAIPYSVGEWIGTPVEPAAAAVELLRPNTLFSRRYQSTVGGESVTLLFVQCSDPRDLVGHYPPNCYAAHGFVLEAAEDRDWTVGGMAISGRRYRFEKSDVAEVSDLVIDNTLVLPDGSFARDMDGVNRAAKDLRLRQFGAAQLLVIASADVGDRRRDEIFEELVGACLPLIRSAAGGVKQ